MTIEPLTPERRRAMTRRHLLDAAAVVFAREGFHGATLDEVAATAGFTKGAVYSNFKNKDDLFLALLDDRSDRQLAVVMEVLEGGSHEAADQEPRIRALFRGDLFWDADFGTLYLEFVLYARRHPEAQVKLAASFERSRTLIRRLIEEEYATIGRVPSYSTEDVAEICSALFGGLGIDRLVDPRAVTERTFDTALALLYDALVGGTDDRS
ncbi:MAG TPA: TetR/AcrR family transcriptional regulator [Acidimicrobiia bacterium]|nr:TetR/AcrR family transcriptional regulator [Acidimicrobiia bacterium]